MTVSNLHCTSFTHLGLFVGGCNNGVIFRVDKGPKGHGQCWFICSGLNAVI